MNSSSEEIVVLVDCEGGITVEVKGVKGTRCLELTRELENALGTVQNRDKKQEFYQQAPLPLLRREILQRRA